MAASDGDAACALFDPASRDRLDREASSQLPIFETSARPQDCAGLLDPASAKGPFTVTVDGNNAKATSDGYHLQLRRNEGEWQLYEPSSSVFRPPAPAECTASWNAKPPIPLIEYIGQLQAAEIFAEFDTATTGDCLATVWTPHNSYQYKVQGAGWRIYGVSARHGEKDAARNVWLTRDGQTTPLTRDPPPEPAPSTESATPAGPAATAEGPAANGATTRCVAAFAAEAAAVKETKQSVREAAQYGDPDRRVIAFVGVDDGECVVEITTTDSTGGGSAVIYRGTSMTRDPAQGSPDGPFIAEDEPGQATDAPELARVAARVTSAGKLRVAG